MSEKSVLEHYHELARQAVEEWDGQDTGELFALIMDRTGETPEQALLADGREPTRNERHLLSLLSWRQKEAREARAELERLAQLVCDFQAASMLDVGRQGGPCRVEPRHVEQEMVRLHGVEDERDSLRTQLARAEDLLGHYRDRRPARG